MKEPLVFPDHLVLKEVRPMDDRPDGVKQIVFITALPDRGAGYTTAQLVTVWKREVIAAKKALQNAWVGANLFLSGPLASGMELFFADSVRNYRNVYRQVGATQEFVRACGIDPDPDVQAAHTVTINTESLTGYGRAL